MTRRRIGGLLLSCSLVLLLGCGGRTEQPRAALPLLKTVTLHVKDMAERLDLA
jgi:hypothetical protein